MYQWIAMGLHRTIRQALQEGVIGCAWKLFLSLVVLSLVGWWGWYGACQGLALLLQDFATRSVEEQQQIMTALSRIPAPQWAGMVEVVAILAAVVCMALCIAVAIQHGLEWLERRYGINVLEEDK